MNSILICLVAMFSTTLALPVNNDQEALLELLSRTDANGRNSVLENALISALEDLRETMVTGSENIPVLDPVSLNSIYLDDSLIPVPGIVKKSVTRGDVNVQYNQNNSLARWTAAINARIEINDLTVSQLSTFELNTVSISIASIWLQRYNVVIDGEVPVIDVDVGNYDLFLNTNGLSLFGNGDAKITIIKPRVKIELLVGIRPRLGIYLNVLSTRVEVSITDIQPKITGMFNNPVVDSFINLFVKNFVLKLLENYQEQITETISPLLQDMANEILDDINFISIFG